MSKLSEHQSNEVTKMLIVGRGGAGKTGGLASLVADGYKIKILDFDDGLDYLKNNIEKYHPDKIDNVEFHSLRDEYGWRGGKLVVTKAQAWAKAMNLLGKWDSESGGMTNWGSDTVLVIDSLTLMCRAAMNNVLALNNRLDEGPEQRHWGFAQNDVMNQLSWIQSPAVKCNVIVMAHIDYQPDFNGVNQGQPKTGPVGKGLGADIPILFNTMLLAKEVGAGANKARVIRTAAEGSVSIKHPIVENLAAELPIASAYSTIFKAAQKAKTKPAEGAYVAEKTLTAA